MPVHTIYLSGFDFQSAARTVIDGEEAHHVIRVVRAKAGDGVRLANGMGQAARATIAATRKVGGREGGWEVEVSIDAIETIARAKPAVHAYVSPPKGERIATLVESLSQVGAASFTPLLSRHTSVDPREGKLDRVRRMATESMKQCQRAWEMEVGEPVELGIALESCRTAGRMILVAEVGEPLLRRGAGGDWQGREIALFVGPEGGWHEEELRLFKSLKAELVGLGPHIMRIETAAAVGVALVMAAGEQG